jgi:cephalosporin-C deacetylase
MMKPPQSIPHNFPFDPTGGYTPEQLHELTCEEPEPADFEKFWKDLYGKAARYPFQPTSRPLPSPERNFTLEEVFCQIYPGYRIGMWVLKPRVTSKIRRIRIQGHGYGGPDGIDWALAWPDQIVIFSIAPGFHLSENEKLPKSDVIQHVIHGIENPETYVLGACAAAIWRAVDLAEQIRGDNPWEIYYHGWSFGGGIGALALPWERRIKGAELGQPTFGYHSARLGQACVGSGESVRMLYLRNPSIRETLRYFDSAFSVRHLETPTVFACAYFDPAVIPPGQWAVANNCRGPKRISPFLTGHFEYFYKGLKDEELNHRKNLVDLLAAH